jgi:hypothetical protein
MKISVALRSFEPKEEEGLLKAKSKHAFSLTHEMVRVV